jgi:hypothetical protein
MERDKGVRSVGGRYDRGLNGDKAACFALAFSCGVTTTLLDVHGAGVVAFLHPTKAFGLVCISCTYLRYSSKLPQALCRLMSFFPERPCETFEFSPPYPHSESRRQIVQILHQTTKQFSNRDSLCSSRIDQSRCAAPRCRSSTRQTSPVQAPS